MIKCNIKNCERYEVLHPQFKKAFSLLASLTADDSKNYEDEEIKIVINNPVTSDTTLEGDARLYEAHRDYIDIHYIIDGSASFACADISELSAATEYNSRDDYQLFSGDIFKHEMKACDLCIVYPEDGHIPSMCNGNPKKIKTAVVKIRL